MIIIYVQIVCTLRSYISFFLYHDSGGSLYFWYIFLSNKVSIVTQTGYTPLARLCLHGDERCRNKLSINWLVRENVILGFDKRISVNFVDGSAQDCSNSIAHAPKWLQSCTKPSTYKTRHEDCEREIVSGTFFTNYSIVLEMGTYQSPANHQLTRPYYPGPLLKTYLYMSVGRA